MRIGLIIYGALESNSGGYSYDRKLVAHLRAEGDEVEVISLPWRDYARHLSDNLRDDVFNRLLRADFDLLLQDELNHPSLFLLNRWLRRVANYPIISIVHHLRSSEARPAWANWLYRQIERRYLETVDGFVFNSRTTRQAVERLAGAGRPQVVAYPGGDRLGPGLCAEEIQARARQPGTLRILFLGNVIPRKGLHVLFEALERLPRKSWRLCIAGGLRAAEGYARKMRRMAAQKGFEAEVKFLGFLEKAELIGELERSQVLVVPSSYEGFGIAYLEGMAFGLPAIATKAGAAHEIIRHGENGFLVEAGDARALAQSLRLWQEDRAQLEAMSLAARKQFTEHPSWEQSAGRIREFLLGLS